MASHDMNSFKHDDDEDDDVWDAQVVGFTNRKVSKPEGKFKFKLIKLVHDMNGSW